MIYLNIISSFLIVSLISTTLTPASAMPMGSLHDNEDAPSSLQQKPSAPEAQYFEPEKAPTKRLEKLTSFWASEVALQLETHYPHLLSPTEAQSFAKEVTSLSEALGDRLDAPLTLEEAVFLLNHRQPIDVVKSDKS